MTKDTMTDAAALQAKLPPPCDGSFRRGLSLSRRITATFFYAAPEPTYEKSKS